MASDAEVNIMLYTETFCGQKKLRLLSDATSQERLELSLSQNG